MSDDRILIADDDASIAEGLAAILTDAGYAVDVAHDGATAREQLAANDYGVALIDLMMPEVDGLALLKGMQAAEIPTECIIITGQATVDSAVQAMREGAYDYIEKPIGTEKLARLKALIPKALDKYAVQRTNRELAHKLEGLTHYGELTGHSEPMRAVYQVIEAVAASTASVLILGESGTGKELVARAIHAKSERAKGPFFALNCAALPKDILENELFGHEKGAFTGSTNEKAGAFEMSDGGTIFLDEVAEMSPDIQVKLLRALESRTVRRLGGRKEISVDIRVVAATNKDIDRAVAEGELRDDLFYRLAVVEITLPPLRERAGDIKLLAGEFLTRYARENGKKVTGFDDDAMRWLHDHRWPGNVRELKNAVERAVVLCQGSTIGLTDIATRTTRPTPESTAAIPGDGAAPSTLLGYTREALFAEFARFLREKSPGAGSNGDEAGNGAPKKPAAPRRAAEPRAKTKSRSKSTR